MPTSIAQSTERRHRLLPDVADRMVRADVRKSDQDEWKAAIGRAIKQVQGTRDLKEFAVLIERDERQVARWIKGEERPHLDAIFAVADLQIPLVLALAELAGAGVEIQTVVTVRRQIA